MHEDDWQENHYFDEEAHFDGYLKNYKLKGESCLIREYLTLENLVY